MIAQPILRISRADLENLMSSLAVRSVKLAECAVSERWRLSFLAAEVPTIHYGVAGIGRMMIGDQPAIDLNPHTLVIVPQGQSVVIEMSTEQTRDSWESRGVVSSRSSIVARFKAFDAGDGEQRLELIIGYFSAAFGSCISLFGKPVFADS